MKENKNIMSWRITLAIMLIFGLGFTLGKVTSIDRLARIEGYRVNVEQDALALIDVATDGNATGSNAYPEEDYATDPNATSSNAWPEEDYATNPNATSSNAEPEDEEDPVVTDPVKVELDGKDKIELKNENLTDEHIKYIRTSTKDVIIDAANDTKISKELLSAISAVNKNTLIVNTNGNQFVFYGSKIETIADTNVYMNVEKVSSDEVVLDASGIKNGVVISFIEGNRFPEGTIVRVKATGIVKEQVTADAKVYSYNAKTGDLKLVQTNIGLEDNYYNLKIAGDTKYLLVNKDVKLAEKVGEVDEGKEVVEFVDSNMTYLLVIAGSVVVIFVVAAMLIANRGKQEIRVETPVAPEETNNPSEPNTVIDQMVDVINEKKQEQQNKQ